MYITKHSNLTDRAELDRLWALYELAYEKIAEEDVTRELLYRSEFDAVMADPTYRTTVVRSEDGEPLAMAVIATDISVTRYLSVPYFRRHHPERLAAGRIHYIMWAVVHPDHQGRKPMFELARGTFAPEIEEGTMLVFDAPESNQPNERGGIAALARRIGGGLADVSLTSFGVSRYYALDFAPEPETTDADSDSDTVDAAAGSTSSERV